MRGTVNWWAGWSILLVVSYRSLLRVGHRVATLLDSTQESILALRYNFWRLQGTQSCRGKPVLICILALSLVFTPYLSNAVVSAKSPHYFHALVALYETPSPPKLDFYYVNRSYCTRTDSPRSHRLPQIAPIARAPIHHDRTDCPKSHRSDSAHVHRSAEIAKRFQYSVLRSPYRTAQQLPIPLASTERIFACRFDEIDRMCAYRFPKS